MRGEPSQGDMALGGGSSALPSLMDIAERIGTNRTVLALSLGRIGDAIDNSALFIVVPLYADREKEGGYA